MMDSLADIEAAPSHDIESDCLEASVAGKRTFDGSDDGGATKKKAHGEPSLVECTRRVAELALVLSAMMEIRGGRSPTASEMNMMAEARTKVVELCGDLAPIDIVPRDAVGVVMEDLGLNKFRDQRQRFRPPQFSIAEKMSYTRRKMEESKAAAANAASYSSQRPRATDNTGPLNTVRIYASDNPSHPSVQSGGIQAPGGTSTPLSCSYPANGVRQSVVSSGWSKSQAYKDSGLPVLPKAERPPFRLDGELNGTSCASQVGTNPNDHPPVKAAMWSHQTQSPLTRTGPQNKVLVYPSANVETSADLSMSKVNPQASRDQSSKSFITQATSGNLPPQIFDSTNYSHPPGIYNGHREISKLVQNLLHPQLPQIPTWTPPSREYMSKALTCQICKLTINEVENALVCDACEKGFHLNCSLSATQSVIPIGEWHCSRCLLISNGKPLPPKYGRVMRNMNVPKMSVNNSGAQSSSEKKAMTSQDQKTNQQKVAVNVNPFEKGTVHFTENSVSTEFDSEKMENTEEMHDNELVARKQEIDVKSSFKSCLNTSMVSPVVGMPPTGRTDGNSLQSIHVCSASSELMSDRDLKTESSRKDYSRSPCSSHDIDKKELRDETRVNQNHEGNQKTLSDDSNDHIRKKLDGSDVEKGNYCGQDVVHESNVRMTQIGCDSREQVSSSAGCPQDALLKSPVSATLIGFEIRRQGDFSSDCGQNAVKENSVPTMQIRSDGREQDTFIADGFHCGEDVLQKSPVTMTQNVCDSKENVSCSSGCGKVVVLEIPVPNKQIGSDSSEQVILCADGSNCGLEPDAVLGGAAMITEIDSDKREKVIFSTDEAGFNEHVVPDNPVLFTQIGSDSRDQITFIADGSDCGQDLVQENQVKKLQIGSHNIGENVNFSADGSNCRQDVVPEIPVINMQTGFDSKEHVRYSVAGSDCIQNVQEITQIRSDSGDQLICSVDGSECRQDVVLESAAKLGQIGSSDSIEQVTFSADVLHNVVWVGDIDRVLDEKTFYQCCCINGIMYKLQDYGFFCYGNGRLIPSKLQEMWEDSESWSKWISISQCYFPDDLPEVVRQPGPPESNEVYESNHVSTVMAGLIHGPCLVLPPDKYIEELERRTHLGMDATDELRPVFQCKWVYDEYTGVFEPIVSS